MREKYEQFKSGVIELHWSRNVKQYESLLEEMHEKWENDSLHMHFKKTWID